MSLLLMKERIKQSGFTLYNEQIKDARDILAYDFRNDVSYAGQVYFWMPGENPRKGRHLDIKLYNRKYSSANGNSQQFLAMHTDKIEVGDYIYNESDNTYWICTEAFDIDSIHYEGKLTQCNWHLRWQRMDGTVLEYPCQDLNSTQYNSGETGNSTITLGSSQHMEKVQATADTIALASPQRFYISKNNSIPYIVTQNDTTANNYGKGICSITMTQDINKEDKDRPDLGICDYIEPSASALPQSLPADKGADLKAIISGNKEIKTGFSRTYILIFTDKNGNPVDYNNVDFRWEVESNFIVKQDVSENKIKLLIEDEALIGSSFLLKCLVENYIAAYIEITIIEGF